MAAEPRTCSRTTTVRGQDSPASTAPDVPTALTCLSGASTMPTAPDEHGAQTSRAQRGALAPGTIMGRTGYETTRPRARAFENYHRPRAGPRHGLRGPWEGGRRTGEERRSGGRALRPPCGSVAATIGPNPKLSVAPSVEPLQSCPPTHSHHHRHHPALSLVRPDLSSSSSTSSPSTLTSTSTA